MFSETEIRTLAILFFLCHTFQFGWVSNFFTLERYYLVSMGIGVSFCVNPFPSKPWFLRVCSTSLLKTMGKKEKLLVMSNFSFFHTVFYPFEELSAIFIKFKLLFANSFSLENSKICCLGKGEAAMIYC